MPEREEGDFERRPIPESQRYLSVDITFDDSPVNQAKTSLPVSPSDMFDQAMQTKTHLGLQSCALVQYYIANYKHLKPVAILLKRFLALHNFNSPYYGKPVTVDDVRRVELLQCSHLARSVHELLRPEDKPILPLHDDEPLC